jgi:hypothetical protein
VLGRLDGAVVVVEDVLLAEAVVVSESVLLAKEVDCRLVVLIVSVIV